MAQIVSSCDFMSIVRAALTAQQSVLPGSNFLRFFAFSYRIDDYPAEISFPFTLRSDLKIFFQSKVNDAAILSIHGTGR